MAELGKKRRGELLRAVFNVLADHPDGIQAKDALAEMERRIELTEFEQANYPGTDVRRFEKTVRFVTINAVKAGWMVKDKGVWTATDEGLEAAESITDPGEFLTKAGKLYKQWVKDQPPKETPDDEESDDPGASLTLEKAEEMAWEEVRGHLHAMDPYEFQHLVAGLLRGMDYHVSFVAPAGKDRGIDILAQPDPLGTQGPRVKVQVKREQSKTDAKTLRAFLSVLKEDDVGAFVTLGGFTSDAEDEARNEARRITLIGPTALFDLWVRYYESIPDADRRRLPIKQVAFLATGDMQGT